MMAARTFVSSQDEANEKVSKLKSMILDKILDAIPSVAKAAFRFFGEQLIGFFCFLYARSARLSHGLLHL